MRKQVIGFVFLFVIGLVCAGISLPHAFNGKVEYSDGTNVQGVLVAKINDVEVGRADIVNGVYDLVVESENEELISFYFEGELIGTYVFDSFKVTELDFVIEIPNLNDDGDNGGGSSPRRRGGPSNNPIILGSNPLDNDNAPTGFVSLGDDSSVNLSGQTEDSKGIPFLVPLLIGVGILIVLIVVLVIVL